MNSGDHTCIWQASDWPRWHYDLASLAGPLADVSRAQGLLLGRLVDAGMALRDQASLEALTEDVIKTSEIECERLDAESVRSSIARRLGVDIGALAPVWLARRSLPGGLQWTYPDSDRRISLWCQQPHRSPRSPRSPVAAA